MMKARLLQWLLVGLLTGAAIPLAWFTATRTVATNSDDAPGNYDGTALAGAAPDFGLVDQSGTPVALSDLRGRVIVLTFMDSECLETCPLTAIHLRRAYQTLGPDAAGIAFLGVNVNVEANSVADVAAATRQWRLDEIATWHFLTGSAAELEPVWEAYHVGVFPDPERGGELWHTSGIFLIDQAGQQRWYVSTPMDEAGQPQGFAPLSDLLVKHIRELLQEG